MGKNASEDSPGLPTPFSPFSDFSISESEHSLTCIELPGLTDESSEVPGRDGYGGIREVCHNDRCKCGRMGSVC